MTDQFQLTPLTLDKTIEDAVRTLLGEHFAPYYLERTASYVESLLAMDHYASRFHYLMSVIGPDCFRRDSSIFISGCGAGSEMLVARQFGFGGIYGAEVEWIWVRACEERMRYLAGLYSIYYDGNYLPFATGKFQVVASGHVIEHTACPRLYLKECMRVLAPGGILSLEFPNRYHYRELHTGLPSFEWLPTGVRNVIIRGLASRWSPLNNEAKSRYRSIISTHLQQISLSGVRDMLTQAGCQYTVVDFTTAAPGIIRCVICKESDG